MRFCTLALAAIALPSTAIAQSPSACGDLANGFGPFDYRTEHGNSKTLVESAHFTPPVEAAIRGNTTGTAGGDLDYTLRAFPNHHRALLTLMKLADRERSPQPNGMRYSVNCWFDRAVRFRPDDLTVRMLYANFLYKSSRPQEARQHLAVAEANAGNEAFTRYNLGLVYFDGKDFDKALTEAQRAMQLDFPRTELRDKLKAVGKWVDPPTNAGPSAGTGPSDAARSPGPPGSQAN